MGPVWSLFETPPEPPKMQMLERFGGQIVSGLGSIRALVFIKIRQPQRRVISSTNQSSSSSLKLAVFKFQSQVPVARRTFTRGLARIPSSIFPGHLQNYAPCSPIPCLLLHRFSLGSPLGDTIWQMLVPPPPPGVAFFGATQCLDLCAVPPPPREGCRYGVTVLPKKAPPPPNLHCEGYEGPTPEV